MKIIHCADIHADSSMEALGKKASERRAEIVDAFERMIQYANENDIHVIMIAGDMFDTKVGQQKTIKKRMAHDIEQNSQIDFLYLRGNHDEDVNFFEEFNLANLKLFSKDKWTLYSYQNVDIAGREFSSTISPTVYNELNLQPSHINIVMMHGQVSSFQAKKDAPEIALKNLQNKNIDYLALGHIHQYKKDRLDSRATWCYSGCLEGRGFDECGEKGFVVLDITDNKVTTEFVPVGVRVIQDVKVQLEGELTYHEIFNAIQQSVSGISQSDIIHITLQGEVSEDTEIETEAYYQALKNQFYFLKIKDETKNKIDYEKYKDDVSLKGEFIRLVNSQTDLSEEEKSKIIITGIKALKGDLK